MPSKIVEDIIRSGLTLSMDESRCYWAMDMRDIYPFSGPEFDSNYAIETNLIEAGVLRHGDTDVCNYDELDTEYSCMWVYFEENAQAEAWVEELLRYIEWLANMKQPSTLTKLYRNQVYS